VATCPRDNVAPSTPRRWVSVDSLIKCVCLCTCSLRLRWSKMKMLRTRTRCESFICLPSVGWFRTAPRAVDSAAHGCGRCAEAVWYSEAAGNACTQPGLSMPVAITGHAGSDAWYHLPSRPEINVVSLSCAALSRRWCSTAWWAPQDVLVVLV
jgi:hypothetical protein